MANHTERNLLHAYLDDELDLVRSMELEDHLTECGDCAREVASYRALKETVHGADLCYPVPQEFRERLMSKLQESERPEPRPVFESRSIPWWNWASVAACVLIVALAFFSNSYRQRGPELAKEIVADHVRSLMPGHLTDVLTSDQHTVKPWFTGKLDFSPQVRDLTSDGFELIGGRLEYLNGRNAAAIVYQRRKHVINVFSWPLAGPDEQPRSSTQQGFNLIQWKQGGMYYCAISDLNQQELSELSSSLRK